MSVPATQRILRLKQLLFEETDENHELSMEEIIRKLEQAYGHEFNVDKRAIKRDLEALNNEHFEVVENVGEKGKKYYSHQARLFETYQLRLLVDAVLSARFITSEETETIIRKLKKLTSRSLAKDLPTPLIYSQTASMDYKQIKLNIDKIHRAIAENYHLHYQYGTYNVHKTFVLHREGEMYDVKPYALIWHNDYYYLIGYFVKTDELRHYRVDRMRNVEISDRKFKRIRFDITDYVNKTFHMFSGEEQRMKIQFDNDLINPVLDRFGLDADIHPCDESSFILSAKASISDGLLGWILNWGSKAKVISPDHLVEKVKQEAEQLYALYHK